VREIDLQDLTKKLLQSGISPRHARRAVSEIRDHYDDLVDFAIGDGVELVAAHQLAAQRMGPLDAIVAEMASRRELKTWVYRYPRLAVVFFPLACVAALPAMPLLAGIAHRNTIARWGGSFVVAAFITALMMLTLQLSILLG
tara:strand:- start:34893 stop:35318 length:426 start_codon:yes stop_codon:yes gene_type:complete